MKRLTDAEQLDWLQLIRTDNIGPITFHRLVARFGSPGEAMKALPQLAAKAGRKLPLKPSPRDDAEAELDRATTIGARLLTQADGDYPEYLAAIPDAPPIIYVRGHATLFERPAIAIIGARNASGVGRKIARNLAKGLGQAEIVVASGLARGIDGAAHEAALKSGTIAVVAGGVDVIYPPEHGELTERIANEGAIISEQPPGATPTARDFPKRNRLISGLSRGVCVVEAAARSGTLITARFALEQGREVFAVPGSPLDPRCQGANRLIRDGATLVERADDIIEALSSAYQGAHETGRDLFDWREENQDAFSEEETGRVRSAVLETLSFTPLHRDELLREIDAPASLIIDALIGLVLAGEAEEHSGGKFSLKAD